jgi:DNA-3-methyladenine glycosylase I
MTIDDRPRCGWMGDDALMQRYHDEEWGVPVHDERKWFEYLVLDAFQAGLSWKTVLHKREGFRKVFRDFDPGRVARLTSKHIDAACANPAIVRNRLKVEATVKNARAFLDLQERHGSFDAFIWSFTDGEVIQNAWTALDQLPASTALSDIVSRSLKKAGFCFVGSTICYAFLQAGGIVNDHVVHCFRHRQLNSAGDARRK